MTTPHPTTPPAGQVHRASGVLLAAACGDALGVPYEFRTPPTGKARMLGGGLGPYQPGEWSDDTQMAVCIAQVAATGADLTTESALDQVASAFETWCREAASDIGTLTSAVLYGAADRLGSPAQRLRAAAAAEHARTGHTAGNGALMRTAVVGLTRLTDRETTAAAARAIAELTHADPLAGDSCVLWSEAVRVAVTEHRLDVRTGLDLLPPARRDTWARWITAAEDPDAAARLRSNGFTVTALQAAWHAITTTPVPADDPEAGTFACDHLQDALHTAVRIGHDTDTVAAIAGGMLGAYWGASAAPAAWRRVVHGRGPRKTPVLRARDLIRLAVLTARGGHDDQAGWPSNPVLDYTDWGDTRTLTPHPHDPCVLLGGVGALRHLPHGVDAVVSLARLGEREVPAPGVEPTDHVEVWFIDDADPARNPNLDFVLADTARVIADLRAEGHTVLVHCVPPPSRTPSVAVAHSVLNCGVDVDRALADITRALPGSQPNPASAHTLKRLSGAQP